MSNIKSTSIVVHQFSDSNGTHWPEADANATALVGLLVRCIRLTSPLTTVAYCGMSYSLSDYVTLVTETDDYYREKYLTDGVSLLDATLLRHYLTCRIAEMDWYSIQQVDLEPCSVDLICRSRCKPGKWIGSVYGRLTTWSRPFANTLSSVSFYDRWRGNAEIGGLRLGRKPSACHLWESSPNEVGTGQMLAGLLPDRGVSVDG